MKNEQDIDILICRCLSCESTPEDESRLMEWIGDSEQNREHFMQMKNIWDISGRKNHNDSPYEGYVRMSRKTSFPVPGNSPAPSMSEGRTMDLTGGNRWRKPLRFASVAVFLLLAFTTTYLLYDKYSFKDGVTIAEVSTPYGTKSNFTLPDGSQVWLNTGSTIRYASDIATAAVRNVEVTGEAFFKVHSDKEHPFVVKAGILKVTATGTSFNVRSYESSSKEYVTLVEGVVALETDGWNYTLHPNQTAVYDKSLQSAVVSSSESSGSCAWIDGRLVFENDRLSDILERLEELYSVEIQLGEGFEDCRCYATFGNESLDRILTLLTHITPMKYSWQDSRHISVR